MNRRSADRYKIIKVFAGVMMILTLLTTGCSVSPAPAEPTQTLLHPTPGPEETVQDDRDRSYRVLQRLRITNRSDIDLHDLVVIFPEERIEFSDVPAGTTTDYQEVPHGVYRYAAYDVVVDGQQYEQPVIDWIGETPMQGDAFTYILEVDPTRWKTEGQVIQLVEVTEDQPANHSEGRNVSDSIQTYTDPAGQLRVSIPSGWQPGDEEGSFYGVDGALRVGYLPEMAFMFPVYRVCERLANTPGGPARKVVLSPLAEADACLLIPYPEMSADRVRLVVENPAGEPEQRYFYLEADQAHLEAIAASLQLLDPPAESEAFPYPAGPLRPEDETFWGQTSPQPGELTVEEYTVVEAAIDSPTSFEFQDHIPDEVFQKRAAWRGGFQERRLSGNNALLEPFGYSLKAEEGSSMDLYALYRGDEVLLDEINEFWPVSVNASGNDFALVVGVLNGGYRLVRNGSLESWDPGAVLFNPPVFSGDHLLTIHWDGERSQAQVRAGNETIYAFASVFLTSSPVKGLWSWQDHWLLEVDGFLIQDGENLNERLGFEEIFGWQTLSGKPFYYFRKGPRVGISYDGQVLPFYYDDIIHYRCCEPAAFNAAGNEDMAWFYGLREGVWYYVEIGAYDE